MEGGEQFQDWGARKILLLAVVHKVQENGYNLETIFNAVNINRLKFKLTGDFAFLMPSLGLLKGCASCNPCPLCDQERSKEGRSRAMWDKSGGNLRTLGSLLDNYMTWTLEGEKNSAAQTKRFKSVTGPLLVFGEEDTHDMLVLDKVVPGPLHHLPVLRVIWRGTASHLEEVDRGKG